MTVSIDADNTVTFEDEQNRMITLHIAELDKLISILPQLRALLDDPQ
ncbi:MAG: hypothetical protein KDK05_10420 [Candidatus Competibacteraceae bacterium]|nr:hypothetical protein [Candidatus Competibacteraceae bacterium]